MTEYTSAVALSKRLIEKKGRLVDLVLQRDYAPDPSKPWEIDKASPETQTVKAVQIDLQSKFIDGSTVVQTDKQFIIAAASTDGSKITTDHLFVDKGYNHRIIRVSPLEPGGECVLFNLIVR